MTARSRTCGSTRPTAPADCERGGDCNDESTTHLGTLGPGRRLLTTLGLLFGPAGEASADTVAIDLYAAQGNTALPGAGTSVTVLGYCQQLSGDSPCGAPTAPGGPTLTVAEGDEVTITLHNTLSERTSLYLGGQPLVPDTAGVAVGGAKDYTFVASKPGTYLYEAGLTGNAQHQVAMGLYGALVVQPATAGRAYDDVSTAFDTEQVMLLSEIDPALNNATDPAAFDMRNFAPRYFLINGKVHPNTTDIVVGSGKKVLLRYVNAGVGYHSMAVLGADQRVVGLGGSQLKNGSVDTSRRYVAETFGPGQTADAIVTVPATVGARKLAVYDAALGLRNSNTPGAGGMLAFLSVTGTGTATATDTAGPATRSVALSAATLAATVADTATGGGVVAGAEYYVDAIGGTPTAMTAGDGAFDSPSETVTATGVSGIASGQHIVFVRGKDAAGNWGPFSSVLVTGADTTGPATSGLSLTPSRTNGSAGSTVAISATADDTASGASGIGAAEYSLDVAGNSPTAMTVSGSGSVRSLDGTISQARLVALAEGKHVVFVRSRDSVTPTANWGPWVSTDLVVDKTGPAASDVSVTPNPTNGVASVNSGVSAVRLSATLTDPAVGQAPDQVTSPVSRGEAFIDTLGAIGTGIPLEAADGAFNAATESVYLDIPLATVRTLTNGDHTLHVRGRDAAGNWGSAATTTLVVDLNAPVLAFSTVGNVNPPGVSGTADNADIYGWNGASFSRSIDVTATPYSLPNSVNVDGFSRVDATHFYLSFTGPVILPGITPQVEREDVVFWNNGAWQLFFDASAHGGLPSNVDAISVKAGVLYFSLATNAVPTGVTGGGDNSDIYSWAGGSAATYVRVIDATAVGIPANANVDGFVWAGPTDWLFSFSDDAGRAIIGLAGQVEDEDVVRRTGSTWSLWFDGSTKGLGSNLALDIDAFDIS